MKLMHEKQKNTTDTSAVAIAPIYRLYGHDDTVSCLYANTNLDVLLSGSTDGSVIVWNLRRGSFLRSLPIGQPVEHVALSLHALIVVASKKVKPRQLVKRQGPSRSKSSEVLPTAPFSPVAPPASSAHVAPPSAAPVAKLKASAHQRRHSGAAAPPPKPEEEYYLTLWTINGIKTAERQVTNQVTSILVTADGKLAFVGTIGGTVMVLNLGPLWQPLQLVHTYTIDEKPPYNAVKSMAFACSEHYLLVGVESGSVLLLPLHPSDWMLK